MNLLEICLKFVGNLEIKKETKNWPPSLFGLKCYYSIGAVSAIPSNREETKEASNS